MIHELWPQKPTGKSDAFMGFSERLTALSQQRQQLLENMEAELTLAQEQGKRLQVLGRAFMAVFLQKDRHGNEVWMPTRVGSVREPSKTIAYQGTVAEVWELREGFELELAVSEASHVRFTDKDIDEVSFVEVVEPAAVVSEA